MNNQLLPLHKLTVTNGIQNLSIRLFQMYETSRNAHTAQWATPSLKASSSTNEAVSRPSPTHARECSIYTALIVYIFVLVALPLVVQCLYQIRYDFCK